MCVMCECGTIEKRVKCGRDQIRDILTFGFFADFFLNSNFQNLILTTIPNIEKFYDIKNGILEIQLGP